MNKFLYNLMICVPFLSYSEPTLEIKNNDIHVFEVVDIENFRKYVRLLKRESLMNYGKTQDKYHLGKFDACYDILDNMHVYYKSH